MPTSYSVSHPSLRQIRPPCCEISSQASRWSFHWEVRRIERGGHRRRHTVVASPDEPQIGNGDWTGPCEYPIRKFYKPTKRTIALERPETTLNP